MMKIVCSEIFARNKSTKLTITTKRDYQEARMDVFDKIQNFERRLDYGLLKVLDNCIDENIQSIKTINFIASNLRNIEKSEPKPSENSIANIKEESVEPMEV